MMKPMELICKFASKDPTRYHLNYVYMDDGLRAAVATDGHRAIIDNSLYIDSRAKQSLDPLVYVKTGEMLWKDDIKYPNMKAFYRLDMSADNVFRFAVPLWFKGLERSKKPVNLCFKNDQTVTIDQNRDNVAFGLDGRLIAEFYGHDIEMHWKDKNSPIQFKSDEALVIVMPLRV